MKPDILFLTLKVFSATGGIEKVCRVMGKALYEYCIFNQQRVEVFSMHDDNEAACGNRYFPSEIFRGFGARKTVFMKDSVFLGSSCKLVIVSHINLLPAAWMIKKISPKVKVLLLGHGIEIWGKLSYSKEKMIKCCSGIISVSNYTRGRVINDHHISEWKCFVVNNCIDPFMMQRHNIEVSESLLRRYQIGPNDKIIFTLTRLSSNEKYKGYEKVIEAVKKLNNPNVKYILAGKCDEAERHRINILIESAGIADKVLLAGFIPDAELAEHFMISDVYVMPSTKEGFGIVFIEAMFYGLPVIAGNCDGSVDALQNGALGKLIDPSNVDELTESIDDVLTGKSFIWPERKMLMEHFGYEIYKYKIDNIINTVLN